MKHRTKTLIALSALTAVSIHGINRLESIINTAKELLVNNQSEYYDWRFGRIHYTRSGTGTPLLFIHDLEAGSSGYEFHKLVNHLSKEHEVFVLDLLGYGLSDKPYMTYTNFLYTQLLNDFIKNIIGRKTDVIATGSSVLIASNTGHNDPEIINRMIFINPQNLYVSNQIPSKQTKLLKILIDCPILGTFIYNLFTTKSAFKKNFRENYFFDSGKIDDDDIYAYLEASHLRGSSSKYAFASFTGKYMNTNILHALREINHSIFIISGEEENEADITAQNYQYYNNAIETVSISETKHLPHLEKPLEVLSQIDTFLCM